MVPTQSTPSAASLSELLASDSPPSKLACRCLRRITREPIEISKDFPSAEKAPSLVPPGAPRTRSRKCKDDANLQHALLQIKKHKATPGSLSSQGNLLICQVRRNVTKCMIPKPPRSSPTPRSRNCPPLPRILLGLGLLPKAKTSPSTYSL